MQTLKSPLAVFEAEPGGLKDNRDIVPDTTDRVKQQTVDQWLQEYETGESVDSKSTPPQKPPAPVRHVLLTYQGHRTTKQQRLVLSFVDIETGQEVVSFFNVSLERTRGRHKGKHYRTGMNGQFNPPPRSKFRKWWVQTVKKSPRRWSRSHKEMKPTLKELLFTGETKTSYRADGSPFIEGVNIRHKEGTTQAQNVHNLGTEKVHKHSPERYAAQGFSHV